MLFRDHVYKMRLMVCILIFYVLPSFALGLFDCVDGIIDIKQPSLLYIVVINIDG